MTKGQLSTEDQKQSVVEQLWLHYFNRTLYEKGLITETERNKMTSKINSRKPSRDGR